MLDMGLAKCGPSHRKLLIVAMYVSEDHGHR